MSNPVGRVVIGVDPLGEVGKGSGRSQPGMNLGRAIQSAWREGLLVAGYHTSFPSLGYVVPAGTGYRWIPVTYQLL